MKKDLHKKEKERLTRALRGLTRVRMSRAGEETFRRELRTLAAGKRPFYSDIWDILKNIFTQPVPAYAAALALVIMLIGIVSYGYLPQAPCMQNIKGIVKLSQVNSNVWTLASEGQKLRKGDIVKTFKNSTVEIGSGDNYAMRLKADTEMSVRTVGTRFTSRPIRYSLAKGKVFTYFNSKKNKRKRVFEIETAEAIASVLGTDFTMASMPAIKKTWLGVLDGVVMVSSANIPKGVPAESAAVKVASRYQTEVTGGQVPTKPVMMMEDKWLELRELYSLGKKPQVAILISTGPTRTRELLSLAPLYISEKRPSVLPDRLIKIARVFNQAVEEKSTEKHAVAIKEFESIIRQYPNPIYDMQFLLFVGAYYEYLENHEKAIETFREAVIKYPGSHLASIAECATGIIYEEKLGNSAKAIESYRSILKDYPQSPEAEEAKEGITRLSR